MAKWREIKKNLAVSENTLFSRRNNLKWNNKFEFLNIKFRFFVKILYFSGLNVWEERINCHIGLSLQKKNGSQINFLTIFQRYPLTKSLLMLITSTELISYIWPWVNSMSNACIQASATTILLTSPTSLSPTKTHKRIEALMKDNMWVKNIWWKKN